MNELRQPDPAQGVFETLLIHAGRPVELEAHLQRLAASLRSLYGQPLPADMRTRVARGARNAKLGRMRLTVTPHDGGLAIEITTAEVDPAAVFPGRERGAALRSRVVREGMGHHKWVDRKATLDAGVEHPDALPLLVDREGDVLEAGRANIFAVIGGVLATPSDDGRILPGIARARTIELAGPAGIEVREQRLALRDLAGADETFLTDSVRGIEPAVSLDGEALPGAGRVADRLAEDLRGLWLSEPS